MLSLVARGLSLIGHRHNREIFHCIVSITKERKLWFDGEIWKTSMCLVKKKKTKTVDEGMEWTALVVKLQFLQPLILGIASLFVLQFSLLCIEHAQSPHPWRIILHTMH